MISLKKNPKKYSIALAIFVAGAIVLKLFVFDGPFLYAGTLEVIKVDLSARLAAAIDQVTVQEGDRVKTGQVLITLACEDFKIAARLAALNYERNIKLLKPGWTTEETIDQLKTQMEEADTRVKWCTITSPIDGKVLSRYHEPGEWMTPGTKILTLANIQDIWAYIYVPQPLVANLALGLKLKGIIPELNNRVFEGTIIKINDEAEFTPKNVQTRTERERLIYGVKVSFKESNLVEILKPGMTIEVELPK